MDVTLRLVIVLRLLWALTVLALLVACFVLLYRLWRMLAPAVHVGARDDGERRVTSFTVVSPLPLRLGGVRYAVDTGDGPALRDGAPTEACAVLVAAGVDDMTVTSFRAGATFVPGRDEVVFSLGHSGLARVRRLDATFDFVDPAGRRITRTVSAVPRLPLGRPAAQRTAVVS